MDPDTGLQADLWSRDDEYCQMCGWLYNWHVWPDDLADIGKCVVQLQGPIALTREVYSWLSAEVRGTS